MSELTSRLRGCVAATSLMLAAAPALASGELALPAWGDIFNADGSVRDARDASGTLVDGGNGIADYLEAGAIEAVRVEDGLFGGVAPDLSARIGAAALEEDYIYNDTVTPLNDIGNSYVVVRPDSTGDLQLYAGVELLSPADVSANGRSLLELEFTQDAVRSRGQNEALQGHRSAGDLRVRLNFRGGELADAEFERWRDGVGYEPFLAAEVDPETGCEATDRPWVVCIAAPPLAGPDLADAGDGTAIRPERFLQVGLDLAALLGENPAFSSILLRTYEDIAVDSFSRLDRWGGPDAAPRRPASPGGSAPGHVAGP